MLRRFLRYVLPSMAAFAFCGLYSIVDGYFVGNNVGDNGLAAINIAYPMIALVNAVGTGIGTGGAVFISISRGEGREDREKRYLGNTLFFLLAASVLCTAFLLAVYRPFLRIFGARGEVLAGAEVYSRVLILCTALQVFATGCVPLLRNFRAAVGAMLAMSAGFVTNIFLDWLFVQRLSMGLYGAALATGIGQAMTVLPCFVFLLRRVRAFGKGVFRLSMGDLGRIAAVGASPFGLYLVPNIIVLILNKFCLAYGGDQAVAAYAVVSYTYSVILLLLQGVGDGVQPLISHDFGEGNVSSALRLRNAAYVTALITAVINFLVLFFLRNRIPVIFGATPETSGLAAQVLPIFGASALFTAVAKVTSSYCYSIGKTGRSYCLVYGEILFLLALVLVLSAVWGIVGVFWALPLAQVAIALLSFLVLWFGRGRRGSRTSGPSGE